jgi:hypothetical protein
MLYCGNDQAKAIVANIAGSHLAEADAMGNSICSAAIATGYIRRGLTPPIDPIS